MNPAPERSIFILDDEVDFREDLSEFLAGQGYRVASTGDARFFTDADMADHDVLLLDLAMPCAPLLTTCGFHYAPHCLGRPYASFATKPAAPQPRRRFRTPRTP